MTWIVIDECYKLTLKQAQETDHYVSCPLSYAI